MLQRFQKVLHDVLPEHRQSILHSLGKQFDYEEYHGAIICGVDCVAVKCHGHTSSKGFFRGIKGAIQLVQNGFISQIKHQMSLSSIIPIGKR